jgi:CRP/FNR family cyclic AMP-dependent transcriptional regulator
MSTAKTAFDSAEFLANGMIGPGFAKHNKGQAIFIQGEPADAVFYVKLGAVKITVVSEHGREAVVAMVGPDSFCGEACLGGQTHRMGTASAMSECRIMRWEKGSFLRLVRDEPRFSEFFVTHVLVRNMRAEEDLIDHLFNLTEKRLARALLLLAKFGEEGGPEPIVKLSQETLAEMIGTTRSHVNRFMNKFRRLGMITYDGPIVVRSSLLSILLNDRSPPDQSSLEHGPFQR